MNQIFVFLALLGACASIGSTLECHECSGLNILQAEACQDPFKNGVPTKTCSPGEVCLKQGTPQASLGGRTIPELVATRGCAQASSCDQLPTELQKHCHLCSTTLCNSAVTIIPSFSTVIVLYIVKLIFL